MGLEQIIQRRLGRHVMGFSAADRAPKAGIDRPDESCNMSSRRICLAFGFIPEFIGRLPMVTVLAELTEEQLVSILTETEKRAGQAVRQAPGHGGRGTGVFRDALRELAAQAIKKGTGARALRGLLEKMMLDVMYEVAGSGNILSIKITRPAVLGEAKPMLRRKQERQGGVKSRCEKGGGKSPFMSTVPPGRINFGACYRHLVPG